MADSPLMIDGKAARLRASCDACNESKTSFAGNSDTDHDFPQDSLSSLLALSPRDQDSPTPTGFSTPSGFQTPTGFAQSDPLQTPPCFLENFSAAGFDFDMTPPSVIDDFGLRSPTVTSQDFPQIPMGSTAKCACASRATTELMSILVLFNHEGISIDLQLSSIKRAILICQDCIDCDHRCITEELTIMTITLLMGRIIQGFDAALESGKGLGANDRSGWEQRFAMTGSTSPPLTWGMLSIEGDEELQLKQHLLLLNFQKLEKLLKQLSESVKEHRIKAGNNNSAHAIACECIHMWLDQRAQAVKNKLLE
ncbi:hypothetical protein N0V90_006387 [Kalmusia sp. IMI 367209]|nr:hypothetical protein N0V90_006387 [Kalmusia sp. IMI 367209]